MRKKQGKKSVSVLTLLLLGGFTLALQLGTVRAFAQDTDNDGFNETGPISLPSGMFLAASDGQYYPQLPICTTSVTRERCIDPAAKDLFVIIQRATAPCPTSTTCGDPCGPPLFSSSDIPMPPYADTYDPLALIFPGLGVTTHELIGGSTQFIQEGTGGWYAVKIVEKLDPCSAYMGLSVPGVPRAPGGVATVWPEKIINWIDKTCSQACFDLNGDEIAETCYTPGIESQNFVCKNSISGTSINMKSNPPDLKPLYYEFIQNVINHEVSHMINLASGTGTSADFHWPIAYGYLMEQFIDAKVTKSNKTPPDINVILYISTGYTKQDKARYRLE